MLIYFFVPLKSVFLVLYWIDFFSQHDIATAKDNIDNSKSKVPPKLSIFFQQIKHSCASSNNNFMSEPSSNDLPNKRHHSER